LFWPEVSQDSSLSLRMMDLVFPQIYSSFIDPSTPLRFAQDDGWSSENYFLGDVIVL